jgi:hypothetical protein
MSELISKQSNRLLFSIIIPGFIGLFPWLLIFMKKYKEEWSQIDTSVLIFVYLLFSIACGLIFHLVGVKIELRVDGIIKQCTEDKFDETWQDYLSLHLDSIDNVRRKYMSFLIDRYQFQLNMCPSILVASIGIYHFLNSLNWSPWDVMGVLFFMLILLVFLLIESYYVGKLLHNNRKRIISDAKSKR